MVLVTVRVGFLFSLKALQKHPNRHTYDFTSSVVLSRVRLTGLIITKVIARNGIQYKQKDAGPVQRTPLPLFPICVKCQPLGVYPMAWSLCSHCSIWHCEDTALEVLHHVVSTGGCRFPSPVATHSVMLFLCKHLCRPLGIKF